MKSLPHPWQVFMAPQGAHVVEITDKDNCMRCGKQRINKSAYCKSKVQNKSNRLDLSGYTSISKKSLDVVECVVTSFLGDSKQSCGRDIFHTTLKRSQTPKLIRRLERWEGQSIEEALVLPQPAISKAAHTLPVQGDREASVPHIKTAGVTDRVPLLQASVVCTVHKSCHCVKGHILD